MKHSGRSSNSGHARSSPHARPSRRRRQRKAKRKTGTAVRGAGSSSRPVVRFVAIFALVIVVANVLLIAQGKDRPVLNAILQANASAGAWVLNLLGEHATSGGREIRTPRYAILIAHGCDGVQPMILFIAAVLATPVRWAVRLIGALGGTVILALLNLFRIVSLYYAGVWFPSRFETLHIDVWGSVFVVLTVVLWVIWARKVLAGEKRLDAQSA